MFLLAPAIFPWDLTILLLLLGSGVVMFMCWRHLKTRSKSHPAIKAGIRIVGVLALVVFLTVAYGSFVEPRFITVTEHEVDFPAAHPLRIAVIGDTHLGPYKGQAYLERVVKKTNALLPDIVLLVGDYILNDQLKPIDTRALSAFQALRPVFGTYAILGNHDHGMHSGVQQPDVEGDHSQEIAALLSSMGITVLRNANASLNLGTETIAIAGVEDQLSQTKMPSLDEAFKGISARTPVILLSHSPDIVLDTLSARAQLIVAAHTHGGQIRLPFIGAVAPMPTRIGNKYDQGLFPIDADSILAITRGVGESGPRARLFAPPEIMLLKTKPQ